MKIGIIGLGNIAQKAYLPVITARPGLELVLCTRNPVVLSSIAKKYRISQTVQTLDELIASGVEAAFVHTATESHKEIITTLLSNSIHVYVDKPIAYYYKEAVELSELALHQKKILLTGFNRRFAPMYAKLKQQAAPQLIMMQKNRSAEPDEIRHFIFDDFIHVVDTLRYLFGTSPDTVSVRGLTANGKLSHIVLELSGQHRTALGIMNRTSGINEEILEYMCSGQKFTVTDLQQTRHTTQNTEQYLKYKDWDTILYRRGFEQIIDHFLHCVINSQPPAIAPEDALATHELCENIVEQLIKK
ncbi:Gfo/Idh/MocA family protein [Propionispora hippei]|uniref:Virulence factor n=1 Tax=Propionispora hippei DSM 15287 TaxID=1123003 RepID=A0A1M6H1R4_9FIRM|nr:Gfo/Idh/MocA family oxidoreductase [Propionispora hippei]SHJ16151.1 virulence factor [Propionispora hippei DSM 15287]